MGILTTSFLRLGASTVVGFLPFGLFNHGLLPWSPKSGFRTRANQGAVAESVGRTVWHKFFFFFILGISCRLVDGGAASEHEGRWITFSFRSSSSRGSCWTSVGIKSASLRADLTFTHRILPPDMD